MNGQWGKGPRLMACLFGVAVAGAALWTGTALAREDPPQPPQPVYRQPQAIPPYEPTGFSLWFNESTKVWPVVAVIAGAITLMSAAGTFWVRWSATTDPAELAKVDPWLRANLEKYQAEQQRSPSRRRRAAARIRYLTESSKSLTIAPLLSRGGGQRS